MELELTESRVALFGGVYSNHLALAALIADTARRGIPTRICLGDLGGFGPHPDKVFPLLRDAEIPVVQGNYDNSIGNDLADCQCGYTDPADNFFAKLSYDYTYRHTAAANKAWMRGLPTEIRLRLGGYKVLLCHGSPRRMNEFVWETAASDAFLARLCREHNADAIVATHTGLHWHRAIAISETDEVHFVNCGVIGRPANDGKTNVWYTILGLDDSGSLTVEFVPLEYDYEQLAAEMWAERLPEEFVETIETGWWTTCLEVLPMKERARGIW